MVTMLSSNDDVDNFRATIGVEGAAAEADKVLLRSKYESLILNRPHREHVDCAGSLV